MLACVLSFLCLCLGTFSASVPVLVIFSRLISAEPLAEFNCLFFLLYLCACSSGCLFLSVSLSRADTNPQTAPSPLRALARRDEHEETSILFTWQDLLNPCVKTPRFEPLSLSLFCMTKRNAKRGETAPLQELKGRIKSMEAELLY